MSVATHLGRHYLAGITIIAPELCIEMPL